MALIRGDVSAKINSCPIDFKDYVVWIAERLGYNTTIDCVVEDKQLTIIARKGTKVVSQSTILKGRRLEPGTVADLLLAELNGE